MSTGAISSLYVHVPFCVRKCSYCAFYSEPGTHDLKRRYVKSLVEELHSLSAGLRPRTVYFGGGTPSLLGTELWKTILKSMEQAELLGADEWTVECNPATLSIEKAKLLRDYGVNRISMGVQSLEADLLARLGRIHSREQVFKSYDLLRAAGFENVGLDLMFAVPGQTAETWRKTLSEVFAMQPEHLSCYEIIYEEDTPLFEQLKLGRTCVNEELASEMYEELVAASAMKGFHQYEIANFARHRASCPIDIPDRACLHNVNYWRGGEYLGLGPSACSYVDGVRTQNVDNTTEYCKCVEEGKPPVKSSEKLTAVARAGELAAFGLRMTAGWPLLEFKQRTGFDLASEWRFEIERLQKLGYAELTPERLRLTREGLRYADWAAELFLRSGSEN